MELPLFPLHTVLFPGRPLALHVFEPRYQALLRDVMESDQRFGVVAIRRGREVGGGAQIHAVGTVARLTDVRPLPEGRADVTVRGENRFRVARLLPGRPYALAEVRVLDDEAPQDAAALTDAVRAALKPYLCNLGAPPELMNRLPEDPAQLASFAAASLQTELPEQQRLLELDTVEARLAATLRLLRREEGLARHLGAVGSLRPPTPSHSDLN